MKARIFQPLFLSVRLPTLLAMFWRAHIGRAPSAGLSHKGPISFIVFRLDSLGDVVMTTPLFRALKKAHPESRCTVVVQECYKSLLATNPHIDEILTLPEVRPALAAAGREKVAVGRCALLDAIAQKAFRLRGFAALGCGRTPGNISLRPDSRCKPRRLQRKGIAGEAADQSRI